MNIDGQYPIGTTVVHWTITDASGTIYNCTQNITINDLMPFITCPDDYFYQAEFDVPYRSGISLDPPDWGDNCPDPVLTWELTPPVGFESEYDVSELTGTGVYPNPNTFYLGVTNIAYTVTDAHGHTATCNFNVTVSGPPVIECPPDTTVTCEQSFDPGFAKLLEGIPPIDWTFTIINPDGSTGLTGAYTKNVFEDADPIGPYFFQYGTTSITWHAQNISGFDECTQYVTVIDTTPPDINTCAVPLDITGCDINAITSPAFSADTAYSSYAEFSDATNQGDATDNCGIVVVNYYDEYAGSCPIVVTRTWTLYDAVGNYSSCTQTITIDDNIDPTASNPSPITVECIGDVPAPDITVVTDEADNCTANPIVAFVSDLSDGNTCPEVITRTYSVTDDCGNTINVTQTITIDDTTDPTASNPAPVTVECIGDVPAPDITVVTDEADNCTANPIVAFVSDVSDGNTCPEVITRTYSVTDDCGNSINVTQTITIG